MGISRKQLLSPLLRALGPCPTILFYNFRIRKLTLSYYLSDGTIKVTEPREENSGIWQGSFLKRHRVAKPTGGFYDISDLACGRDIVLYSKTVRLVAADEFTRKFFEKSNLDIGVETAYPNDPFTSAKLQEKEVRPLPMEVIREKILVEVMCGGQPLNRKYKQYLESEGKVLRFHCLWNDSSIGGETHYYDMHYFLADDTIELVENRLKTESCYAEKILFMKRRSVPRSGDLTPQTSDNPEKILLWSDLSTNLTVRIGNRDFFILGADPFTRDWYLQEHGVELLDVPVEKKVETPLSVPVPPPTGFGSEEDSLNSCTLRLVPKPVQLERFAEFEGVCLRFTAIVRDRTDFEQRTFVVAFYPVDSSVSVWEEPVRNSGFIGGKFAERCRTRSLGLSDFRVGNTVTISAVAFYLTGTDAFTAKWLSTR